MMITPRELLTRVHEIGAKVATTKLEQEMLAALESTIQTLISKPVHIPWKPPNRLYELLGAAVKQQAAWTALERLWFFLAADRVVVDPLGLPTRRRHRAGPFRLTHWPLAMQAEKLAHDLWDGSQAPQGPAVEEQFLVEAVFTLTRVASPPKVLSAMSRLRKADIDWIRGTVVLGPSPDTPTGGRPYILDLRARLAVGRLELFYRRHQDHRSADDPHFLPAHWRSSKALSSLLARWFRSQHLPDNVRDYLVAVRLISLLRGPALFAAVQAGLPAGWRADAQWITQVLSTETQTIQRPLDSADELVDDEISNAMAQVRFLLRRVERSMVWEDRINIAAELETLLPVLGGAHRPPANQALITEWAIALLRTRRLSPRTVRTRITGLYAGLAEHLDCSILSLTEEELIELIGALICSQQTTDSRAVMHQRLKHFCTFLTDHHRLPRLDWRGLRNGGACRARAISLVTPEEAERAIPVLRHRWPHEADALTVALILGQWVGLRREEICALNLDDLIGGVWGSIRVPRVKTAKSRRIPPGALLTPAPIWAIVETNRQARRAQGGSGQMPLLCTERGERWDPEELGKRLAEALQAVTDRSVSMHSLRRGFATFTLLRWAVAVGRARWPVGAGTWNQLAVSPESLTGVMEALGTDATLVLHRLARLLGHASPGVTVAHYIATDVLAEAWVTEDEKLKLRPEIAADLLQCSRQALYKRVVPTTRGYFDGQAVLQAQLDRILGAKNSDERGGAQPRVPKVCIIGRTGLDEKGTLMKGRKC